MPLEDKQAARDRIQFADTISKSEIDYVIANSEVRVLQTSGPAKKKTWKLINNRLLTRRPDLEIRIYGHYSHDCNLSFLEKVSNVRNLSVDCLMQASNIEVLEQLPYLENLSVGIYSLENFDFLDSLPESLSRLYLGATKSKKPDLKHLGRFADLKELYIDGQQKNIEIIGALERLEKLVLRSVSPKDLCFLRKLENLWSLDIKLGGIKELSAIEGLANLKYLELWQIRGLSDISVISSLAGLQYLFLQSLRNVTKIPDMTNLTRLRRVYLETMKGLIDVSGLLKAPALEEFIHVSAQNMSPEQYRDLMKSKSLKRASVGFGSDKKNRQLLLIMKNCGVKKYQHEPFTFL